MSNSASHRNNGIRKAILQLGLCLCQDELKECEMRGSPGEVLAVFNRIAIQTTSSWWQVYKETARKTAVDW